ncbi:unnamed protein product [Blepharisma stoltei]|uniref:PARP-type domain-containing protein n=1 Tax=Blepharisma stoltei TaxID=1481888 RepID=A0AAU9JU89_9CILI|nr:unnamed protein product [Blepharisma stoltei]
MLMQGVPFNVEYSKTNRSYCRTCRCYISKDDIRIYIYHYDGPEYYHLNCYTPKVKQYICKSLINII